MRDNNFLVICFETTVQKSGQQCRNPSAITIRKIVWTSFPRDEPSTSIFELQRNEGQQLNSRLADYRFQ